MTDTRLDELRARRAALDARLDGPDAAAELDVLKGEIGALFKNVEGELAAFTALRASVMELIEKWKGVRDAAPRAKVDASHAARFVHGQLVVHTDHVGASTFIEKGWNRISAGDYAGAEQMLNRALALSPNDSQAASLLGWSLMLQDKFDVALTTFQQVLVREPENALARVNVGYICLKKQVYGEAIEHLSSAIRLDNDKKATLYAHFYLGLVYLERDMFDDAQTFFQKALALGPNLIEAYYELGRAYWFGGRRDEAMKTWKAGLEANKFNPWGKRCADVLATVQGGGEP